MRPTSELIQIASAGGRGNICAITRPASKLIRIATAACQRDGGLVINGEMPTVDLINIAQAGKGCVEIVFK